MLTNQSSPQTPASGKRQENVMIPENLYKALYVVINGIFLSLRVRVYVYVFLYAYAKQAVV